MRLREALNNPRYSRKLTSLAAFSDVDTFSSCSMAFPRHLVILRRWTSIFHFTSSFGGVQQTSSNNVQDFLEKYDLKYLDLFLPRMYLSYTLRMFVQEHSVFHTVSILARDKANFDSGSCRVSIWTALVGEDWDNNTLTKRMKYYRNPLTLGSVGVKLGLLSFTGI